MASNHSRWSFDPWTKLGVPQAASYAALRKARNMKLKLLHPDARAKQAGSGRSAEELTEEVKDINASFEMLSNKVTRRYFSPEYYNTIVGKGGDWSDCWKSAQIAAQLHLISLLSLF